MRKYLRALQVMVVSVLWHAYWPLVVPKIKGTNTKTANKSILAILLFLQTCGYAMILPVRYIGCSWTTGDIRNISRFLWKIKKYCLRKFIIDERRIVRASCNKILPNVYDFAAVRVTFRRSMIRMSKKLNG